MVETTRDPNLHVYNAPEVVAYYAELDYLSPCETVLFEMFLKSRMNILDLGVGGGRTTPYLSALAARYVGVDYAQEMITLCRKKFPRLEFLVADAANLSAFADSTFDAVVMTFNGMDYVLPDESRLRCLREIRRVLRPEGILIFSSHNPRAILVRQSWSTKKIEELARRIVGNSTALLLPAKIALTCIRAAIAFVSSVRATVVRLVRRLPTRAFWRGEGYLIDSAHGGLLTHCAQPGRVRAEVASLGYRLLKVQGDDYPRKSRPFITDWYYYVFAKLK
jgi:SAM-dependent methyltransferase